MSKGLSKAQRAVLERMAKGDKIIGVGGFNAAAWFTSSILSKVRLSTLFRLEEMGFIKNERPSPYTAVEGTYTITDTGRAALESVTGKEVE